MKEFNIQSKQNSLENNADVILFNGEVFTYKNTGITRRVFVNSDKTFVIKIPVTKDRQDYNQIEIDEWNGASDEVKKQFATTEMLFNGFIKQEFLHTFDDNETIDWLGRDLTMEEINFAMSCREDVGFDKDGNLKCYDLHEYKKY